MVLADDNFQSLIIFLGLQLHNGEKLAKDIVQIASKTEKLVVVNWMAMPPEAMKILHDSKVPAFSDPARGVKAVAALVNYTNFLEKYRAQKKVKKLENTCRPICR